MAMTTCPECGKEVSSLATTCPHCGFPIKVEPTEKIMYRLYVGKGSKSILSVILRVCAVIIWVLGVIASIALANQTTYHTSSYNYYSYSETKFSFGYFLVYLLAFGFAGWTEWLLANVVGAIYDTRSMVAGMVINPIVERIETPAIKPLPDSGFSAPAAETTKAYDDEKSRREEKDTRLKEYWESHAEEKTQLENERSETVQQINNLISQKTKLADDEQSQIRAISQKFDIKALDDKNSTYEAEIDSLGGISGKRRDELIDAMTLVLEERHKLETKYKKEIQENSQAQITKINEQIHQLQARIREIDTELTKDR